MSEGEKRVITANVPEELALALDEIAARTGRSKSWIVNQALKEWVGEERRRHELTLEAFRDFDEGRTFTQEEVEARYAAMKAARRKS